MMISTFRTSDFQISGSAISSHKNIQLLGGGEETNDIQQVSLEHLHSFENHPFQVNDDEAILSRILNCFRESFYFLTHNSRSIGLMLWNSLCGAVVILTVYFLQARLPEVGIEGVLLGPVLFVISLGGTVRAKLVLYVQKWKYWKVSVVCVTGIIIGFVCRISSLPVLMCLGGFILNVWDDLLQVHTDVILNERFPSPQRATLVSVESLCFSIVMIVLSPIMGWMFSLSYFYMNFTKNQQ